MDINKVFWHDGLLTSMSLDIDKSGKSKLVLTAELYDDGESAKRNRYKLSCKGVVRSNLALDFIELKDNMFAGNISNGYLKNNTLWLYFSDGMLEVTANKFKINKLTL